MGFTGKLVITIIALEFVLLFAMGVVFASNVDFGAWEASAPLFIQAGIVMIILGALIAVVLATMTTREIGRKTGAMEEGWSRSLRIFHSIPAGVVIIDPQNHKIVDANKAALKAFGKSRWRVIGKVCHKFLCPAEEGFCPITDLGQDIDSSERLLVKNWGKTVPVLKTVVPIMLDGKQRLLEIFFDISDRKDLERRLRDAYAQQENLANYDLLTGVLNRRAVSKHAEAELNRAERGGALSLVMLDIDHFKKINDTHGHPAGDEVLKTIARTISNSVRPYDWVGRWGGEEFLVVLPNTSIVEAGDVAERLRKAVGSSKVRLADGRELGFAASFGITSTSLAQGKYPKLEELVKQADDALYRAKDEGRNRVCIHSSEDQFFI